MVIHKNIPPGLWGLTVLLLIVLALGIAGCDFIDPDDEGPSSDGLHPVLIDGFWGFINAQGRIMIAPNFETIGAFSDGLAAVQLGVDWGYIDTAGAWIQDPEFAEVDDFHLGLGRVRLDVGEARRYGYVDRAGRSVWFPSD